jgi:8-oxo-dGTP pyrophosphatase MutT (NUDIX family)
MLAMQNQLTALFSSLVARAAVEPPATSRPLYLNGRQCGWVAADVPGLFAGEPGLLAPHADGWSLMDQDGDMNAGIARLARHLHRSGRLRSWRGELLALTDLSGAVLGVIERSAVRPLGIATRAVHLNAWTPAGDMWIAQRALDKSTDPGMWDTLVGGLVSAAESDALALERESWEEAGLPAALLAGAVPAGEYCVRRILPEGYQAEWVGVHDVVLPADVVPENQDGEVAQIRTASRDDVVKMIADDAFTLEAALAIGLSFVRRGWLPADVMAPLVRRPD